MQVCTIARARATIGGPMRESRTPCNAATFHWTTTLSLAAALPAVVIWNTRIPIASRNQKRATLADEGKFSDIEGSFNFMDWRHILGHRAKSRLHSCLENYEIAASGTSSPAHLDNSAARQSVSLRGSSPRPSSIPKINSRASRKATTAPLSAPMHRAHLSASTSSVSVMIALFVQVE